MESKLNKIASYEDIKIFFITIGIIAICLYTSIIIKVKIDLLNEAERQNLEEDKNLEEDTSTWD